MEYGLIISQGISHVRQSIPLMLEDADNELSPIFGGLLADLYDEIFNKMGTVFTKLN